jgi:hypothetical protein
MVKQQIAKRQLKKVHPPKKPKIEEDRTNFNDHMLINSESTSSLVKFGGKQNFLPLDQITEDPVPPCIIDKSSTLKLPDTNKIDLQNEAE